MEQHTTRIGIEPGPGLVGRFGDTVIVIPRGGPGSMPMRVVSCSIVLPLHRGRREHFVTPRNQRNKQN